MLAVALGFGDFGADSRIVIGRAGHVDRVVGGARRRKRWLRRIRIRRKRDVAHRTQTTASHHRVGVGAELLRRRRMRLSVGVRGVVVAHVVVVVAVGRIVIFRSKSGARLSVRAH